MLVNNFSVGIIGMLFIHRRLLSHRPGHGYPAHLPDSSVQILVTYGVFPLIGLFVEPAKVLFLNNAINHGIFTPLGAEQVSQAGKSIFYMIETNPGPAQASSSPNWLFSKDKMTKHSLPARSSFTP